MWFSRRKDNELREELDSHLAMAIQDRVERGEPADEAVAAARREFGNAAAVAEVTRAMWGYRWLERLAQDLRYGARLLRRNPGFAAVAIFSLAVGIGANTALFQVINAVRLRSLPVASAGRLAEIRLVDPEGTRGNQNTWNPSLTNPIWEVVRARQQGFSHVFAWSTGSFDVARGGETRYVSGLFVSGTLFEALGVRPIAGRMLTAADDVRGCPARAVISDAFWTREYGGDRSVVGRMLSIDAQPVEIVGVAQSSFYGLEVGRSFDVAIPICADAIFGGGTGRLDSGTTWWLTVMGHVRPGWTIDQATAQLGAISPGLFRATLPANYPPVSVPTYLRFKLAAYPASGGISQLRENYERPLWLLLGTALLVLLIACANLANLLLARASAREREIAIRLGLGASRGRVVRQLLTESLLLAAAGAACGAVLAGTLSRALVALITTADRSLVLDTGTDLRVLGFTIALAVITCVLFGLAPALRGTQIGPLAVLKTASRTISGDRDRSTLRRALVVGQVALSLVLLVGALLFARTLNNLGAVDPGFRDRGVLVAVIDLRRLQLQPERRAGAVRDVLDRLGALPGIERVSSVAVVPISGGSWSNAVWTGGDSRRAVNSYFNRVSRGYFDTLRIPLRAGRDFDPDIDTPPSVPVAIVNETLARQLFGAERALGGKFTVESTPGEPERTFEVVGIVSDAKYFTLREPPEPTAFLAKSQEARVAPFLQVVFRSALPDEAATAAVTRSLSDADPRISVTYRVLTAQIDRTVTRERLMATLSAFFGGLAVLLTLVGLYGVVAYGVMRRTNEIGVRIALGATTRDILAMVVGEAGVLVAIGLAIGLMLSIAGGHAAATLLYGLEPRDPATLLAAVAALSAVAFAATYLPARAATRIEPTSALRTE